MRLDRQLVPQPALAERWENPDARTWVFHLRHDARFSDGGPVTADDVVASLTAAREKKWCNEGALQSIESVSAADPATVRIVTRSPFPNLLSRLHYGFVLPARAVSQRPLTAIGTGPCAVERWLPGRELELSRNRAFRGPPIPFGRLRFVVVPDDAERVLRLVSGRADIAESPALGSLDELEKVPDVRVVVGPSLRVLYLAFRLDRPPYSDARVREAIDVSLDRGELVRRVYRGRARAASQLVAPTVFGFDPSIPVTPVDRARSRRLLVDAGYGGGLSVTLEGPEGWYVEDVACLREVARQLAQVGVSVTVITRPKREWVPLVTSGGASFFMWGWACETRDAGDALDALMHSPTLEGLGKNNYGVVADAELDRLIDSVSTAAGSFERNQTFGKALARVHELHAIAPLVIQPDTVAMRVDLPWEPPLNHGFRLFDVVPGSSLAR